MRKKVLVVDDHAVVRKGITSILLDAYPFLDVEEAGTASRTFELLSEQQYDLLLLDLHLPDTNIETLLTKLQANYFGLPTIIISVLPEEVMLPLMQNAGIKYYIQKDDNLDELKNTIRKILIRDKVKNNLEKPAKNIVNPFQMLSAKELFIALAVVKGKSNAAISRDMNLSPSTVSTYKQRIFDKLSVRSVAALTRLAMLYNMLNNGNEKTNI